MPATFVVSSVERPVLGFALERVAAFLAKGTKEQREISASLAQMQIGLDSTPPGALEVEFLEQDAYQLGIRLFYTSVELEESVLDTSFQTLEDESEPDPELEAAVRRYFPDAIANPAAWDFQPVRSIFTDLGIKIDHAVTELAPRARAIYNSDREEMSDKAIAVREERARRRAPADVGAASPRSTGGVAVEERPAPENYGWGVEFSTGLSPDDIPQNSFRPLTVGSVHLFITRYDDELGAIDGVCAHQRANLANGKVVGTTIECGRHGATFDLRTGEQVCPPFCQKWMDAHGAIGSLLALATPDKKGGDLPRYPLRVENGEIILRV
jgi:nitrite reductase/ring-hydroxylating ferredoxin subunit